MIPPEVWARLESGGAAGSGHLRQRVNIQSPVDVYVAVERPSGSRVLALGFDEPPHTSLARDVRLRGLRVSEAPFPIDQKPWTVSISPASPDDNELFGELADDLVSVLGGTATGDQASDALAARLESWHRFLEHAGSAGLSAEAAAGLYGELWCLRDVIAPAVGVHRAVLAWRGPLGANQDFQGLGWCVEVKSSRQLAPATVRVSNERQLDAADTFLALAVVGIEERPGGPESLVGLIASIRTGIVRDPEASATFEDRLLSSGFLQAQADSYETIGYAVRKTMVYQVRDAFPRITEAVLPVGLGTVSYDLSIDACEPYRLELAQFQAALKELQ